MAQDDSNEIATWLKKIGLFKYYPLLTALKYSKLEQISGLTPEEFKDSLKEAFDGKSQLGSTLGFDKVAAPDLGTFGSAVRRLNQEAGL